jgi:hypothetical protein
MDKKPRSGSLMKIPDHISESLETIFWVQILKFFDADPDSVNFIRRINERNEVTWVAVYCLKPWNLEVESSSCLM